ncbi:MAG: CvpA family protein [Oscillospiraceae bacterium]|nr:CvpA family protein [Oscillospiraceae bacterium]
MGGNFWWVFDAAVVAVVLLCVIHCARKGFSKIIVTAIGCVVSFAIAWVASQYSAETIYNNFFKQGNIKAVETAIEDYHPEDVIKTIIESNELSGVLSNEKIKEILKSGESLDMLYEYANSEASNIIGTKEEFEQQVINEFALAFSSQVGAKLPPYVAEEILANIHGNEELFISTVDMLLNSPENLPKFIEMNYIREPAKKIASAAVFLIVFFVLMTIIVLVSNRSGNFGLLNGYDRLDKFVGGVMGCVEAIAVIMIIAFIVKIIINISDDNNSFVSMNTIENTLLFKHFYKFL